MNTITQGNGYKVAGTQKIYKRVAEICSKYGIEFEDKMLHHSSNKWNPRTWWSFLPCQVELHAPTGGKTYLLSAGMTVYDDDPDNWYPINCDKEDFEANEIAAFDELVKVLSETAE